MHTKNNFHSFDEFIKSQHPFYRDEYGKSNKSSGGRKGTGLKSPSPCPWRRKRSHLNKPGLEGSWFLFLKLREKMDEWNNEKQNIMHMVKILTAEETKKKKLWSECTKSIVLIASHYTVVCGVPRSAILRSGSVILFWTAWGGNQNPSVNWTLIIMLQRRYLFSGISLDDMYNAYLDPCFSFFFGANIKSIWCHRSLKLPASLPLNPNI